MANWCLNEMTITHDDPRMMTRVEQAWNDGSFFQTLIPCPEELRQTEARFGHEQTPEDKERIKKYGSANWYDWQVKHWGTKWDVGYCDDYENTGAVLDGVMTVAFDSAYSPPIAGYEELIARGYRITAYYFEPGDMFWGSFIDGSNDLYSETDYVPPDIDRAMNVTQTLENYKEILG